jgi:dipeptidyl aminopeptidase/acylaminoacyl peptidase
MNRALVAACAAVAALALPLLTVQAASAAPTAAGPAASRIVFADGSLFLVRADGTGLHAITSDDDDASPSFSPDGTKVAYVHAGEVWVTSDGGTPRQVTHVGGSAREVAWSPNGNWLAFTAAAGDFRDVFRVHPVGGAVQRMTYVANRGCYAAAPAWSPDSSRIAYQRIPTGAGSCTTGGVVVQKVGGGSGFLALGATASKPSFTADGKHLVFVAACSDVDVCGDRDVGWLSNGSGGGAHMVAFEHLCAEGDLCLQRLVGAPDRGWVEGYTWAESDDPDANRETCFQGAYENASGTVVQRAPSFCVGGHLGGQFDVH